MLEYCLKCGAQIDEGRSFCQLCGAPVGGGASAADGAAGHPDAAGRNKGVVEGGAPSIDDFDDPRYETSVMDDEPDEQPGVEEEEVDEFSEDGVSDDRFRDSYADDNPTIVIEPDEVLYLARLATGEEFALELPAVVGKGSAATCRVSGNPAISRTHARIWETSSGYSVTDLGSTNGTWVDGERLAKGDTCELRSGAALMLANESFVLDIRGGG